MSAKNENSTVFVDLTGGAELVVNSIATGGYWGSQHVICLASNRYGTTADGKLEKQAAIVARLRFDNDMAKMLRDALDQQIKSLEAPPRETAN